MTLTQKFLLDEHFSGEIVRICQDIEPGLSVRAIQTYEGGCLKNTPDESILQHCRHHQLVLVSADVGTIPSLVHRWLQEGREHSGVLYVSTKSLRPNNYAGIAKRLIEVARTTQQMDWTNISTFL